MKLLSWSDVIDITEKVSQNVLESNFSPDYIVAVATGGLFPLGTISKKIGCDKMLIVKAKKQEENDEVSISYLPEADLTGKNVLLVDEIVETGKTLNEIEKTLLSKCKAKEVKTCTLAMNKDVGAYVPDFYGIVEESEWIVFPWEDADEFGEYPYNKK